MSHNLISRPCYHHSSIRESEAALRIARAWGRLYTYYCGAAATTDMPQPIFVASFSSAIAPFIAFRTMPRQAWERVLELTRFGWGPDSVCSQTQLIPCDASVRDSCRALRGKRLGRPVFGHRHRLIAGNSQRDEVANFCRKFIQSVC